ASFGSAEKQRLLRQNSRLLSQRYPGFDAEVRGFVAADPLVTARLALGLSLVADRADESVPVWLAHAMGGGAENDLRDRIAARTAADQAGVVVRIGQGKRWKLELHTAQGKTAAVSDAFEPVAALIARLPRRRIIYSCGVGDRDPAALPGFLLALAGRGSGAIPGGAQPLEVLLHDYFPISPSYTLLGKAGVWRGVPRPDTVAGNDPAHCWTGPGGAEVDLAAWQAGWGAMLEAADRIEVFSAASGAILSQAYPHVGGIVVREHRLPSRPPHLTPGPVTGDQPVIGILGNIGPHKGARIVQQLSRDLARSGAARLVVIGRVAPEYALASWAHVHGPYQIRDLPGLVARYGISAWLIPSVWPETFSFTTHEALATGLPVLAFDLGAQGAAVEAAENGIALPCPGSRGLDPGAVLAALRESAP
ncbi:MAG: glycosyltransferase, partial [Pseudomonadota bacterium]